MGPSIPDEDADPADEAVVGDEEPVEVFLVGDCIAPSPDGGT